MAIEISSPPEYNAAISKDAQLSLALQRLEYEDVQNLERKEQMIMGDDEFATMMQHQEKDEAQKSMEKQQRAMTSMTTDKALLIVQRVLSLHNFLQSYIPQKLGVALKVTTLEMYSMFFFADSLLHIQAVFRVARKMPLWT